MKIVRCFLLSLLVASCGLLAMDTEGLRIQLVMVPAALGGSDEGMAQGPEALRSISDGRGSNLMRALMTNARDVECDNTPDEVEHPYARNIEAILTQAKLVKDACAEVLSEGKLPIVVGGDCTAGIGLFAALIAARERVGSVSLGGYYGLNTPSTTPSGDMQGMLLGSAAGVCARAWYNTVDAETEELWGQLRNLVVDARAEDMVFAGVRNHGKLLLGLFELANDVVNRSEVAPGREHEFVDRANERLAACDSLFVVFDAETALEGSDLEGGLNDTVAMRIISGVADANEIGGVAFCGYNPDQAPEGMGDRVYNVLEHIVRQLDGQDEDDQG